jgi:hypothetical protein
MGLVVAYFNVVQNRIDQPVVRRLFLICAAALQVVAGLTGLRP